MRHLLFVSFFLSMFIGYGPVLAASPALSMGDAIDKAGRQRMLTQRMIKSYVLAGMDLKPGAQGEMRDAADLFGAQLAELTGFAVGSAETEQIRKIALLWADLDSDLRHEPSLDKAGELNDLAELLLQESHQLVLLLEKRSGSVAGKLVNMSGRQRMLSQRIAKIYLLQTWGVDSGVLAEQYQAAVADFSAALSELSGAGINTPEIKEGLRKVDKNWKIFLISDFSKRYKTRVPSLVVRSMDKILVQMNDITGLYAKLN